MVNNSTANHLWGNSFDIFVCTDYNGRILRSVATPCEPSEAMKELFPEQYGEGEDSFEEEEMEQA